MKVTKVSDDEKPRDFVRSISHGLDVLRSFDENHLQMTVSEVSERTGMTRAGARRYLLSLAHLGYIAQEKRLFRLTAKVLELGYAFMASMPLSDIAQPYLEKVTRQTGETSAVAILEGHQVVHIARANAQRLLAPTLTIGKPFYALYTSTGRVLLSCKENKEIDRILENYGLSPFTRWSTTSKENIRKELILINRQGYAIVDQEMEEGLRSLAVPIMNNRGLPVAAINIVTNVATVSKKQLIEFLPVLKQTAKELQMTIVSK